jgi:hypothetical protein
MTKKEKTGKLYSKVEGEVLMETAPEDKITKEINKNDEKMDKIEENCEITEVDDARMTDEKDKEIVFKKDRAALDTSDNSLDSLDSSSSTGSLGALAMTPMPQMRW